MVSGADPAHVPVLEQRGCRQWPRQGLRMEDLLPVSVELQPAEETLSQTFCKSFRDYTYHRSLACPSPGQKAVIWHLPSA